MKFRFATARLLVVEFKARDSKFRCDSSDYQSSAALLRGSYRNLQELAENACQPAEVVMGKRIKFDSELLSLLVTMR